MDQFGQGSSHLFVRLRDYYLGKKEASPLISEQTAILCGLLFTAFFIAPFYLSKTLRTSSLQSRDAPTVIKARIRAVGLSCVASTVVAVCILVAYGHATARDILRLFAVWPFNPADCFRVFALVAVLFVGPLYETLIVNSGWRDWRPRVVKEKFVDSLPALRNNIVAPWAEEWVFRSLVVSLYLLAKVPAKRIVLTSPLIFGAAHIHHLIEFLQSNTPSGRLLPPGKIWTIGIVRSLFQLTYTSLFGFFAAFVYLRTGNVFAAITAHTFCNFMGFPRVSGKVGQHEEDELYEMTVDVAQGKRDDSIHDVGAGKGDADVSVAEVSCAERPRSASKNLGFQWTVLYYLLLLAGAYAFYRLLWPMTESDNALAGFVR